MMGSENVGRTVGLEEGLVVGAKEKVGVAAVGISLDMPVGMAVDVGMYVPVSATDGAAVVALMDSLGEGVAGGSLAGVGASVSFCALVEAGIVLRHINSSIINSPTSERRAPLFSWLPEIFQRRCLLGLWGSCWTPLDLLLELRIIVLVLVAAQSGASLPRTMDNELKEEEERLAADVAAAA